MPNRWESSGRPLFVKTVYVNGNRHAILSQEDPLLRSRNAFFKKASRPNSSISFGSNLSVTSSESRESNSVGKPFKGRKPRGWKDLSSELQDCLIKLRLASSNEEKMIVSSPEEPRMGSGISTIKRQKWGRGRKKKIQNARERLKENEPEDFQNKDRYRYVYNFENTKGKKSYCFVKISSEPPGVILDSVCNGSKNFFQSESNNLVISAAFHNLVMAPHKPENVSGNKSDYFPLFEDPGELYWNNYLTRFYYNSLSERVIQWIDRTRKRKRTQNLESNFDGGNERISSGRTFLDKSGSGRKKDSVSRKTGLEEDVEDEVRGEPNVETALSVGKLELDLENDASMKKVNENASELFKYNETECGEGLTMRTASGWERRISQEKGVDVDSHSVTVTCRCEKNGRDYANGFEIATQEFPERNQKSIDTPNVTRTRPISVRELSPQQQQLNKISLEQIVWASDRDIGRPQLHIFIPTVPSKDASEESLSECEPQITDV